MKMLRITPSMNPSLGGPSQGIRNTIPELEKLGIQSEVVSLDEPEASFLHKDPFLIHALGPRKGSWQHSPKLFPWLIENLSRFDIVIIHGLWLYHSYAAWKAMRQLQGNPTTSKTTPAFFVMPHGMLDPWFQNAKGREIKALRNWIYWKLIERNVVNDVNGLLFTCETELLLARKSFTPYHPKREINVGYGIEQPAPFSSIMQEAFSEKCLGLNNQPYFLFLSRIHSKKGVDLLIHAYANLVEKNKQLISSIPKLVIAGPGLESEYGQSIQKLVLENTYLHNLVFFPGMLTGNAKWGALYGCEAFILPSHQENFGIAVAESLACSKAVLISNQVNIWREIEAGGGGLIFNDSIEGTQWALEKWLSLSILQKDTMRQQAQIVYEKNFAIGPSASKLVEAFQSIK